MIIQDFMYKTKCNSITVIAALVGASLAFSCKQKDAPQQNLIDSVVLKLDMVGGLTYYYTTRNETSMSQEVKGKEIEMANSVETGVLYEVTNDSSGNLDFKTTYRVFK